MADGAGGSGGASGGWSPENPTGPEPTSPLVQIEGKKIADQVIAREKKGENESTCKANCHGEAQTGASAPPKKNLIDKAITGLKHAANAESKGLLPDLLRFGTYYSDSDDPAADAEARQSQDFQQLKSRLGQEITDLPGNMATGLKNTMTYMGENQIASDPNVPDQMRQQAQSDVDKANQAMVAPIKKEYKQGGSAQAIFYVFGIAAAEGAKFAATDGTGNVVKGGEELSEIGAASKLVGAGSDATKVGDPVSVATGEYIETWRDFFVPSELPFDGARFMGLHLPTPNKYVAPLGFCQISSFDEIILNSRPGELKYQNAYGDIIDFDRPFNFLPSINDGYPHLELTAPWLRKLKIQEGRLVKNFKQYDDDIYRLEKIEDLNGNIITFQRDDNGRLERAIGTNGLSLEFENDRSGRRTGIQLIGTGGTQLELVRYTYDARGRMTAADCAFGMSVRYYWHPERDLLVRWHNTTRRSETHFTYDDEGRVLHTQTNGIWNDDHFRYDPASRETTYLPSGDDRLAQRFRYDHNDNVTHEIDALGHTLEHVFDAAGFETAITDANGNTTTKAYDIRGNVKRFVDAEGRATTYAWGPYGTLDMVINGAGKIRRFENDLNGNTVAETCAEGHTTRFVRDDRGRLLRTIFPDGAAQICDYDAHGRLVAITDARGGVTRFSHDPFGRMVEETDALGQVTRYEYAAGAGGFSTPTAMIRADGVRIQRAYTEDGVLASVTDGESRTWRYVYGAFDVLVSIEDPRGGKLAFTYDGEGRIIAVTNQKGLTYELIRDAAGRVIAEVDFDGRRTEYARDPGGRVVETKKPDGVRLAYAYDRTDNLTSIKSYAADDPKNERPLDATHYWYDGCGLLIRASNQASLIELERDGNDRIVCESLNGRKVESKLDFRGNRIERRIGRGQIGEGLVRFAHDPLGMVASIAIDDHTPLTFTRDALGRETRRASSRGFCLDQSWNAVGQLTTQSAGRGPSTLGGMSAVRAPASDGRPTQRRYAWSTSDAPVGIDDLLWGETRYAYDANGQVAEASVGDGFTEKFDYDPAKNVAGVKLAGPAIGAGLSGLLSWQATPGGVVQLARGPNGETVALIHDINGRVVTRRVDRKGFRPKTWHFGYDALDRLVRCDNPEGETWFYRYDPFGRRLTKVRKLSDTELAWTAQKHAALVPVEAREATKIWTWPTPPNGSSGSSDRPPVVGTHFLWDADVMVEEAPLRLDGTVDYAQATRWHFEPASFRPMAKQTADGQVLPIVTDHLGTPREVFGENGSILWAASYAVGGLVRRLYEPLEPANENAQAIYPRDGNLALKPSRDISTCDCPIRFQGQWADSESGLYYNRHRYYDALTQQFLTPDPLGLEGGANPQAYVLQQTTMVDPLGLAASISEPGVKYGVGPYNKMNRTLADHDAHHAMQKAIAKKLVPGYDPKTAPSILVPKVGHRFRDPVKGVLKRTEKGVNNARDLLARDVKELRNMYPDLPNSQLQKLIQMNKAMYPNSF